MKSPALPLLSLALLLATAAQALAAPMSGFRPADADSERAREARLAQMLRPDSLERHLRRLTEEPHVAGTPADRATADYVLAKLKSYGWDARIEAVPVYLNYPGKSQLELLEPHHEPLSLRETGQPWDKDAFDNAAFDAFHGYGAAGEVTAQVVYANYGDVEDFQKLAELGIEVRGRIALVRYGKIFRGLKVRNAERAGATGVLIYSDPADDGFAKADPYPRGAGRPADAIQRGSVQFLSEGPGDPTTPGWASRDGGKRLKPSEVKGIPRIPSLPISWEEAQKIHEALEGPQSPVAWQGAIPLTYHVGPGPAKIHMNVAQDYAVRPIWNVIATLKGRERPDEWVMCGNHRDAWTYGAVDPNSGTICLLEMARSLGSLARNGWRPRRSIVLCSWDGEEYGLLGSTEYAEGAAEELATKAAAYLNVDVAVAGRSFRVNGSQALSDVILEALADVPDPSHAGSVFAVTRAHALAEGRADWARLNRERRWRGEPERPFTISLPSLGSGSDYTAFLDHLGVASADLRFEGLQGSYHSMYDNFEYLNRVIDPGYPYHVAMTDLWTRIALRIAEAEVLPFHYSASATFVLDELEAIDERVQDLNDQQPDSLLMKSDLGSVRQAAARMLANAGAAEKSISNAVAAGSMTREREVVADQALISVERQFLGSGLPDRTWFRNEIYAPGLNTGYAPVPLPRLGQAVLDKDRAAYSAAARPIQDALDRAAAVLEKLGKP